MISFSEEVKNELLSADLPKSDCCRRAMAYGFLCCAEITDDGLIRWTVPTVQRAQQIASLIQSRMACQITWNEFHRGAKHGVQMCVALKKRSPWMEDFLDDSLFEAARSKLFPCEHCYSYFMRSVFSAYGTVSDPTKNIHLEISCGSDTVAQRLSAILTDVGCPPKLVLRQNGQHLYYKNSTAVEDFFSFINANKSLFTVINAKIEREIRNDANRAANCETRNIQKAIVASARQTEAIRKLKESDVWEQLPDALKTTANLRLSHPDVTLTELALLHEPVITKSGLNHRLQKLQQMTEDL